MATPEDHPDLKKLFDAASPDATPRPEHREQLRQKLVEAIRHTPAAPAMRRRFSPALRWAAAAAVLLAALAGGWAILGNRISSATASFPEVLEQLQGFSSVSFRQQLRQGDRTVEYLVIADRQGRYRIVHQSSSVQIIDSRSGRTLTLNPSTRTAVAGQLSSTGSNPAQSLLRLQSLQRTAGQSRGSCELDNRKADLYEVPLTGELIRLWADPASQRPVRVEFRVGQGASQSLIVLDRFEWNAPIPESELSLAIPPGYTSPADSASPESLVECLRICAELNGGQFPVELDSSRIVALFKAQAPTEKIPAANGTSVSTVTMSPELRAKYRAAMKGLAYSRKLAAENQWHYCGQGVKLGDASGPVCWWQAPDAADCTVIYGDLRLQTLPRAQLVLPTR